MALLILAALVWFSIHIGVAGTPLRDVLVTRIGEGPFRGLFSLLSILAIGFLVWSWSAAWTTPLWYAPAWLRWLLAAGCCDAGGVRAVRRLAEPAQSHHGQW
jgi:uncharacterized membrane protein